MRANPALVQFNGYGARTEYLAAVRGPRHGMVCRPGHVAASFRQHDERQRGVSAISCRKSTATAPARDCGSPKTPGMCARPDGKPLYIEGTILDATERVRRHGRDRAPGQYRPLDRRRKPLPFPEQAEGPDDRRRQQSGCVIFIDRPRPLQGSERHAGPRRGRHRAEDRRDAPARHCRGKRRIVARLGGDEFAVIPAKRLHATSRPTAPHWKSSGCCGSPVHLEGQTASWAPASASRSIPPTPLMPTELLNHADLALYQVKASGT